MKPDTKKPPKKDYRKLRREQGLCARCGEPSEDYRCNICRGKRATNARKEYTERKDNGLCPGCGTPCDSVAVSCEECLQRKRQEKAKQKELVINHYGGKCECVECDIDNLIFLTIDHIDGGGNQHRAEIANFKGKKPGSNSKLYAWLIRNNFPPGFRVLCFSCNYATWLCGGKCAHKDDKALELTSLKDMRLKELSDDLIPTPSFQKKEPTINVEQDADDRENINNPEDLDS